MITSRIKVNFLSKLFPSQSLLFVYIVPAFTDWLFTVLGQPEDYWQDFTIINESNPFAHFMLSVHPLFFIFGTLIIYLIFAQIIKRLKEPYNLTFALFLLAAHSWGLSSWSYLILFKYGLYNPYDRISIATAWTIQVVYFLVIAFISAFALKKYISSK